MQLTPFNTEPSEDTDSLWSVFTHPGIYVSALGFLIPVGIGLFCCYFFWCQPARLVCWPLQSGNTRYTIVNDNVEVAPIYRCNGRQPCPPDLARIMAWLYSIYLHGWRVMVSNSWSHLQSLFKDHWVNHPNPGDAGMHITSVTKLRLDTMYCTKDWNEPYRRMHNNSLLTPYPLMWITQTAMCHIFKDKTYLQTGNIWPWWLPCFLLLYSIHTDAFKPISLIAHWPSSFKDPVFPVVTSFSNILIGPQDLWLIMYSPLLIIIPSS